MRKDKIKRVIIILCLPIFLTGCSKLKFGSEGSNEIDKYINEDVKELINLEQDYSFTDCSNKIVVNGMETQYEELTGVVDVLNLYASEKGTEAAIKYKSDFQSGNIRVALINGNNEAVDIVKDSGEGTKQVKVIGKSKIRCIGSNATGNLKIEVSFGPPQADNLAEAKFDKDGTFLLYDYKMKDGNFSGKLYRVYVVNKKAEKVAKIRLEGKLQNGAGTLQFSDDGWGNSGYVGIRYLGSNDEQFSIKVTGKKNTSSEWGFEDCVITHGDEPIPDYLKGLQ